MGVEPYLQIGNLKQKFQNKIWNFFDLSFSVVRLRGPSAKHFWDGLEELGSRLEELGIGDKEVKTSSLGR